MIGVASSRILEVTLLPLLTATTTILFITKIIRDYRGTFHCGSRVIICCRLRILCVEREYLLLLLRLLTIDLF